MPIKLEDILSGPDQPTTLHHSPHCHTDRLTNQRRPLVDVARLRDSGNGNGTLSGKY